MRKALLILGLLPLLMGASNSDTPTPSPSPSTVQVTPSDPTITAPTVCGEKGTINLPQQEGVKYSEKQENDTVIITATPYQNYSFTPDSVTKWSLNIPTKTCDETKTENDSSQAVTPTTPADPQNSQRTTPATPTNNTAAPEETTPDETPKPENTQEPKTQSTTPDTTEDDSTPQTNNAKQTALLITLISSVTLMIIALIILGYIHRDKLKKFFISVLTAGSDDQK